MRWVTAGVLFPALSPAMGAGRVAAGIPLRPTDLHRPAHVGGAPY